MDMIAKLRKQGRIRNAKRTLVDGIWFDSLAESYRYLELSTLQLGGQIKDLVCHPKFDLRVADLHICFYSPDFSYYDCTRGMCIYEDVKGFDQPLSKLKRKLFEAIVKTPITVIWAKDLRRKQ